MSGAATVQSDPYRFWAARNQNAILARNSITRGAVPVACVVTVAQPLVRELRPNGAVFAAVVTFPNTGWLNAFKNCVWNTNRYRSVMGVSFVRLKSLKNAPGP